MLSSLLVALALVPLSAAAGDPPAAATSIAIPEGEKGVGLDDLQFSTELRKVIVPAGQTGNLLLIDPTTNAVDVIRGFGGKGASSEGHSSGSTSAVTGADLLFAIDRTKKQLDVIDPTAKKIVASAPLAGGPDYVRFVPSARELWVTEPDGETIEVFALGDEPSDPPKATGKIDVKGGPESLVIDATRGRAYSHLWEGETVAIDLKAKKIVATWKNGCTGSRGIALDESRGFLFVGCVEGRAAVLDVAHDGKLLSEQTAGDGLDIIAYDAKKRHVYFAGGKSATLTVMAVSEKGELSTLATVPTTKGARCVTTDSNGAIFVGDPRGGTIRKFEDKW